ncbi:MAG: cytochrome bd ubiquinol oxidase subunit [Actinomycetota bacterium]|jgi:cytochrome d ubiquinol oxidase subunit I
MGVVAADLTAARQQMALSLGWHIVIACLGIGLPLLVLIAEGRAIRSGDPLLMVLARRWSRVLSVLFAIGAVSGTILSFELGILWPGFMGRFGDVIGLPFAVEGFAFFLEAIFIGIYQYGWDRLSPRVHWWSGVPIVVAGTASAFFVVAANAFMNQPAGFRLDAAGRVTDIDPLAAMFNRALWPQATHMILAAFIVAGLLVAMVHAFALGRHRASRYHRLGFTIAFSMAAIAVPAQLVVGDWAARFLYEYQPTKFAALEAVQHSGTHQPLHIGGIVLDGEVRHAIKLPNGLSLLADRSPDTYVRGLDRVAKANQPPVGVVRSAFQLMVAIGFGLLALGAWFGWVVWRRKRLPKSRWFWWLAVAAGPAAVVALEAGWVVTEVGRQPWIVYGVLRVRDAVTHASGIRVGYALLVVVYAAMTAAAVVVLRGLIHIPLEDDIEELAHR